MPTSIVAIGQNLTVSDGGALRMAPCSVPSPLADVIALSAGDGTLVETITEPGKLMINQQLSWVNTTPVNYTVLIRVVRRYKQWLVSNPNAIQFRDRWSWAIDAPVTEPVVSGLYNGQSGGAGDVGTNTVAEPNPGLFRYWWGTTMTDEWVFEPINVGSTFNFWYQAYVWTPPPWSDNANKNSPQHNASMGWSRIQLIGYPNQGSLITG